MKGKAMLLSKRYISIMLLGALTVFLTTVVLWHRPAPCATPPDHRQGSNTMAANAAYASYAHVTIWLNCLEKIVYENIDKPCIKRYS